VPKGVGAAPERERTEITLSSAIRLGEAGNPSPRSSPPHFQTSPLGAHSQLAGVVEAGTLEVVAGELQGGAEECWGGGDQRRKVHLTSTMASQHSLEIH
jgi:hypothetical protein